MSLHVGKSAQSKITKDVEEVRGKLFELNKFNIQLEEFSFDEVLFVSADFTCYRDEEFVDLGFSGFDASSFDMSLKYSLEGGPDVNMEFEMFAGNDFGLWFYGNNTGVRFAEAVPSNLEEFFVANLSITICVSFFIEILTQLTRNHNREEREGVIDDLFEATRGKDKSAGPSVENFSPVVFLEADLSAVSLDEEISQFNEVDLSIGVHVHSVDHVHQDIASDGIS